MSSWLFLLFWVLAHSLWQAALVWGLYRAARWLRPGLPSWSASAMSTLGVFAIPVLSVATAFSLLSQALAATPGGGEESAARVVVLVIAWGVGAAALGLRLAAAMRRSLTGTDDGTPRVTGWLRPRIVIPERFARELPEEQLRGVVAHEQEHIRAGDAWMHLAQCWLDTLYFFNPAYRMLSRAAREEREFRCDDAAVREVGTVVYLRALVAVARGAAAANPCELRAAGDMERRVRRLADGAATQGGRAEVWVAAAAALVFVLVLPDLARVPVKHQNAAAWQARMVPAGQAVRGVVTPPLQAVGHVLRKVAE